MGILDLDFTHKLNGSPKGDNPVFAKTMRTLVVGLGIVGTAQAHLLHELGHETFGYDVKMKQMKIGRASCRERVWIPV